MLSVPLRARLERDDGGFTLLEAMLATAIMSVVLALFFSMLFSMQKVQTRNEALVANEQAARQVLVQLGRDLRAADPLRTFTNKATYRNQVEMRLIDSAGAARIVRWEFDSTAKTLTRKTFDSTGTILRTTGPVLPRVRNAEVGGMPVFSYYSQSGIELVDSGDATAADVGNCAIRVQVRIRSNANPGPEPFEVESDAELRNRLPGGIGCG